MLCTRRAQAPAAEAHFVRLQRVPGAGASMALSALNRWLAVLGIGAALLYASCHPQVPSWAALPPAAAVAAFRSVIALADSSGQAATAYCLGHQRLRDPAPEPADPPPEVLRDLGPHTPPLRPAHECAIKMTGDISRTTGRPVLMLIVGEPMQWRRDTLVTDAWYHCGGDCGRGGQLNVWRAGASWHAAFGGISLAF